MGKGKIALFVASSTVVASCLLFGPAQAAPAPKPTPTPTPTVAPYTLGQEVVSKTETKVSEGAGTISVEANCPSGKVPTGGGFLSSLIGQDRIVESRPTATGWRATWFVLGAIGSEDTTRTETVYAVCVNAQ